MWEAENTDVPKIVGNTAQVPAKHQNTKNAFCLIKTSYSCLLSRQLHLSAYIKNGILAPKLTWLGEIYLQLNSERLPTTTANLSLDLLLMGNQRWQTEALPLFHQPPPASSLESLWVMLKIELNKHKTSNLGCSHRQTHILTLWESWLHDQGHWCPIPADAAVHAIKPQHTTADEGIISPDTTTACRSSISTVELVWNHFKLVLHLVKAAGWTALEDATVAPEPLCGFLQALPPPALGYTWSCWISEPGL